MPSRKQDEKEASPKSESSSDSDVKVKSEKKGRVIKFMGSSDIRRLEPGESLLHTVEPLKHRLEWHAKNGSHLIHTADYPEVPKAFWDQLLKFTDFQDVTEEFHDEDKEVPPGLWDRIWNTTFHPPVLGQ